MAFVRDCRRLNTDRLARALSPPFSTEGGLDFRHPPLHDFLRRLWHQKIQPQGHYPGAQQKTEHRLNHVTLINVRLVEKVVHQQFTAAKE
jgi:hypothetical protein